MPVKAPRRHGLDALLQVPAGAASAPDFFATETLQPTWPLAMALCLRAAARNGDIFMPQSLRTRKLAKPTGCQPARCGASPRREVVGSMGEQARAERTSMVHNASKSLARWYGEALVRREALEPSTTFDLLPNRPHAWLIFAVR